MVIEIKLPLPLEEAERIILLATLDLTKGNRTHAAAFLGISLRGIRDKIRRHGIGPAP